MVVPSNRHHLGTFEGERKRNGRGYYAPGSAAQDYCSLAALVMALTFTVLCLAALVSWAAS